MLDVACGTGRHSRYLAGLGYRVTAVDINVSRIELQTSEQQLPASIRSMAADLERGDWPFEPDNFDGVVVVNYLHRPHFRLLASALTPGGVLLFDTFAAGNERFGRPRNPDYLLRPGELLREFGAGLEVVAYEHGRLGDSVRQRLCAVRR